jgi:uncharacterized membrane protein
MAQKKSLPITKPPRPLPIRMARLHARLFIAVVVGLATIAALPGDWWMSTRLLAGWNVGLALYLVLVHRVIWRCDVTRLRRRAKEQDEGGFAILLLSMAATLASLVAIVFELGGTKQAGNAYAVVHVLLAMTTAVLSWGFMHTIFSLHYAHEYYGEGRDKKLGGLNFPGENEPDYLDFLYFSLVIGMTSQVSDVSIASRSIRRVAALHGVLSFFFNLTVLALTVNMISNLL